MVSETEDCLALPYIARGNWSTDLNMYNTSAVFTCDDGYTVSGISGAVCSPNGTWSLPEVPHCHGNQLPHSVMRKRAIFFKLKARIT